MALGKGEHELSKLIQMLLPGSKQAKFTGRDPVYATDYAPSKHQGSQNGFRVQVL